MRQLLGLVVLNFFLVCSSSVFSESLLGLYHETLKSDPRLQSANAQADIYKARQDYSFGALLPHATVSAQGTRTAREATTSTGGSDARSYYYGEKYSFVINQSLYNKSQWENLNNSRATTKQHRSEYEYMEDVVAVDLVDRYTKVLAAEDGYKFSVAEREAADEQLKQIRARYERQLAVITDLLEVEARRDRLLTNELDAANQVKLARESISELVGREVAEPLLSLGDVANIDRLFLEVNQWISEGLANNHRLKSLQYAVNAAKAGVGEATGQRHPTVNLQLVAQQSDIGFENSQSSETESYVAAVTVNMPLFSGGQTSAQVNEAKARLRWTEQQLEEQRRVVKKQIREAFLRANTARERVKATIKAVLSAEKSYEAQSKAFEYGTVTVVDVLDALENLFGIRSEKNQAYYDYMVQRLILYQTSGLLNHQHIAELNGWFVSQKKATTN